MKIISFMNVSNQQSLSTDSGYIFYNILAGEICKRGFEFTFVAPEPLKAEGARHIEMVLGQSKFESRFSFNWQKIRDILASERPDIIIVNQIELLANYKALITTIGLDALVVGYAHCIPFGFADNNEVIVDASLNNSGLWQSVVLNFMSGIQAADGVFVHSKTALSFLIKMHQVINLSCDNERFEILPPPFDPFLTESASPRSERTVMYNHRINSHYGTAFIADLAPRLAEEAACTLKVMDIMGDRSPERNRLDNSVEIFRSQFLSTKGVILTREGCDRGAYKRALQQAVCTYAPYRKAHTWSMSCIDSISMGVPVVAPNFGWFSEFFPMDLRYDSMTEAVSITKKLLDDRFFWAEKSLEAKSLAALLAPSRIADKLIASIERWKISHSSAGVY